MSSQDPASAEWHYADHNSKTTELRNGAFQLGPAPDHVDWEPLYSAPVTEQDAKDAQRYELAGYFYQWELDSSLKAYPEGFPDAVPVFAAIAQQGKEGK